MLTAAVQAGGLGAAGGREIGDRRRQLLRETGVIST
jgi:hypothetical protein